MPGLEDVSSMPPPRASLFGGALHGDWNLIHAPGHSLWGALHGDWSLTHAFWASLLEGRSMGIGVSFMHPLLGRTPSGEPRFFGEHGEPYSSQRIRATPGEEPSQSERPLPAKMGTRRTPKCRADALQPQDPEPPPSIAPPPKKGRRPAVHPVIASNQP